MWPTDLDIRTGTARHRFERLRQMVDALDTLPTTARIPMRILELQRDRNSTIKQYGETLMADASLSARVLSLANSAWAGARSKPIVNISDAVRLIGVQNLMPLLFGVSLAGMFNRTDLSPSQRDALWKTALLKAVAARQVASALSTEAAETAFLAALLQDCGLPVMLACDPAAAAELSQVIDQHRSTASGRERDLFGVTHADVGRVLTEKLKLPDVYVRSVATHHASGGIDVPESHTAIIPALRLAASIPHAVGSDGPALGDRFARQLIEDHPQTTPESAKQFTSSLMKEYNALLTQLGGRGNADMTHFRSFLQDVCDQVARTLTNAIGESVSTVSRLEGRVGELETKAATADVDALTGLLNRRGFMERATSVFRAAAQSRSLVGVGFADVDDFKRVNDVHGHDAGDAALRALARLLRETVGDTGVSGRFGGDEFVFLLVADGDARQNALNTELSRVLSLQQCKVGTKSFPVSFSVGIQWIGVPTVDASFELELRKADELMYTAKRGGKNRCVIHGMPKAAA